MIRTYEDVTPAVLEVMARTTDPRLREIMIALVRHLHGFIVETRLTEAEFRATTEEINLTPRCCGCRGGFAETFRSALFVVG